MTTFVNELWQSGAFIAFLEAVIIVNGLVASVVVAWLLNWLSNQPARFRQWLKAFRQGRAYATYALHRPGKHRARRPILDPSRFDWLPGFSTTGYGSAA